MSDTAETSDELNPRALVSDVADAAPAAGGVARHASQDSATPTARWRVAQIVTLVAALAAHVSALATGYHYFAQSFGDVQLYDWWVRQGVEHGQWPVFTSGWQYQTWVYPVLALIPMMVVYLFSALLPVSVAWSLVAVGVSMTAMWVVSDKLRSLPAAWFWAAYIAVLGPIGLTRLDVFVAASVAVALALAATRPRLAALVATFGAWVKVVPAVAMWPLFAVARRRWKSAVLPAGVLTVGVVLAVAALGGGLRSFSFLTEQSDRGLQAESPGATAVMVLGKLGIGSPQVIYNDVIFTYEIHGGAASLVTAALSPLLLFAFGILAYLIWRTRHNVTTALGWGTLALLATAILFNKVGSPQFYTWLVAPVAWGFAANLPRSRDDIGSEDSPAWCIVGALALVAAFITQIVYPVSYGPVLNQDTWMVVLLVIRAACLIAILAVAAWHLWRAGDDSDTPTPRQSVI